MASSVVTARDRLRSDPETRTPCSISTLAIADIPAPPMPTKCTRDPGSNLMPPPSPNAQDPVRPLVALADEPLRSSHRTPVDRRVCDRSRIPERLVLDPRRARCEPLLRVPGHEPEAPAAGRGDTDMGRRSR